MGLRREEGGRASAFRSPSFFPLPAPSWASHYLSMLRTPPPPASLPGASQKEQPGWSSVLQAERWLAAPGELWLIIEKFCSFSLSASIWAPINSEKAALCAFASQNTCDLYLTASTPFA